MPPFLSRRQCLATIPLVPAAGALMGMARETRAGLQPATDPGAAALAAFPAQDPVKVREMVGASHGNVERVTALLKEAPQLANATYDWGFGDWETALGAASHTGRRVIAKMLMEHGARPDIFTFAMIGDLETVRSVTKSQPGIQRLRGPHGITLMQHAKAGGEESKPVAEYLASLGDADVPYQNLPLTPEQQEVYVGTYSFGSGTDESFRVLVPEKGKQLVIQRGQGAPRGLFHLGDHTFHPAGGHDVRVVFTVENGKAVGVSVAAPAPVLAAKRA